jgi:hypothetical protein
MGDPASAWPTFASCCLLRRADVGPGVDLVDNAKRFGALSAPEGEAPECTPGLVCDAS